MINVMIVLPVNCFTSFSFVPSFLLFLSASATVCDTEEGWKDGRSQSRSNQERDSIRPVQRGVFSLLVHPPPSASAALPRSLPSLLPSPFLRSCGWCSALTFPLSLPVQWTGPEVCVRVGVSECEVWMLRDPWQSLPSLDTDLYSAPYRAKEEYTLNLNTPHTPSPSTFPTTWSHVSSCLPHQESDLDCHL